MKLPASILCALAILTGCMSPDDIRLAKTRELRIGMTTAEVEKLLGKPRSTERFEMGTTTANPWPGLVWKYEGIRAIFQNPEAPRLNAWITN